MVSLFACFYVLICFWELFEFCSDAAALASTALHHSKDVLQYQASVVHNLPEMILQSDQLSSQIGTVTLMCFHFRSSF
jgi:hypothetical protein